MTEKPVWQRPRLRTDEEDKKERRVGWLALFHDLVFFVVIAQLSHELTADVSLFGRASGGSISISQRERGRGPVCSGRLPGGISTSPS